MSAPIVWTIAGSDSGGGAGIQADLKSFHALGVHGCTVLTGVTAQNTSRVSEIAYLEPAFISAQFEALAEDLPPLAIKSGMLGSAKVMSRIADHLDQLDAPYVCDPVMVATSGSNLMDPSGLDVLKERLIPRALLLTPNLIEAQVLSGRSIQDPYDMEQAAETILKLGCQSVLVKGGHGKSPFSQDYFASSEQRFWLTSARILNSNTHGTGCTLSAAITACLGLGYELMDALVIAKAYVSQGIRTATGIGLGKGPVQQGAWPNQEEDLPWLTSTAQSGQVRSVFPKIDEIPIGFYPIFDRAEWLEKILPLGVRTVQLRIKDLSGEALRLELEKGIRIANEHGSRLFVNDHWELAIKLGAYGVHLGQEDLETADLERLSQSGLRLGISTHCYAEVARALAFRPSYIAYGPIYETTAKPMRFGPRGLEALKQWRGMLSSFPIVAIGGISLARFEEVLDCKVDGIAVISAITASSSPEAAAKEALKYIRSK